MNSVFFPSNGKHTLLKSMFYVSLRELELNENKYEAWGEAPPDDLSTHTNGFMSCKGKIISIWKKWAQSLPQSSDEKKNCRGGTREAAKSRNKVENTFLSWFPLHCVLKLGEAITWQRVSPHQVPRYPNRVLVEDLEGKIKDEFIIPDAVLGVDGGEGTAGSGWKLEILNIISTIKMILIYGIVTWVKNWRFLKILNSFLKVLKERKKLSKTLSGKFKMLGS